VDVQGFGAEPMATEAFYGWARCARARCARARYARARYARARYDPALQDRAFAPGAALLGTGAR
jgi:hypothetical protein